MVARNPAGLECFQIQAGITLRGPRPLEGIYKSATRSPQEGMKEMFHPQRLQIPESLHTCLAATTFINHGRGPAIRVRGCPHRGMASQLGSNPEGVAAPSHQAASLLPRSRNRTSKEPISVMQIVSVAPVS